MEEFKIKEVRFSTRKEMDELLTSVNNFAEGFGELGVSDLCDFAGIAYDHDDPFYAAYGWLEQDVNKFGYRVDFDSNSACTYTLTAPKPYILEAPKPQVLKPSTHTNSMVDHPNHYQSETGLEAWDVIEAFTFDLKGVEAFDTGNALKYLCRWSKKNGVEDLKKARRYLNHLIEHVEKLAEENKPYSKKEND